MSRYRIITPTTPRAPGATCADFEQSQEIDSLRACTEVLRLHDYENCCVWLYRPRERHWERIMDTTYSFLDRLPGVVLWNGVVSLYQ